jgi:N,N'-diacetyllegionaminate synthase
VNIKAMLEIKKKFRINVGYSDHTLGINASIVAVANGAKIIEKHITLNKKMSGPDHKASITEKELKNLVSSIRETEIILGQKEKKLSKSEKKNIMIARNSIVANIDIKKGDKFTKKNLTIKRPGYGISPMNFYKVLGKKATRNFKKDELIKI